ncbi:MAG: hypothetical protein M3Y37_09220 [Chloroflexota bacterium]|nr:hypothetical protein [Chloroflexota bacterium]
MKNPRAKTKLWLLILAALLLAPALPVRADVTATDSVIISASVAPVHLANVPSYSPDCRMVYANGRGPNGSAYCVYTTPLTIYVASSGQWSATIVAQDGPGNSGDMRVQSQALRYGANAVTSYSDAASALHMKTTESPWVMNHAAGESTFSSYLYLRVDPNANPEDFAAIIDITITQHTSGLTYILTIPITFNPI